MSTRRKLNTIVLRSAARILERLLREERLFGFSDQFLDRTANDLLTIAYRIEAQDMSSTWKVKPLMKEMRP